MVGYILDHENKTINDLSFHYTSVSKFIICFYYILNELKQIYYDENNQPPNE
jgi:hypothetical protein